MLQTAIVTSPAIGQTIQDLEDRIAAEQDEETKAQLSAVLEQIKKMEQEREEEMESWNSRYEEMQAKAEEERLAREAEKDQREAARLQEEERIRQQSLAEQAIGIKHQLERQKEIEDMEYGITIIEEPIERSNTDYKYGYVEELPNEEVFSNGEIGQAYLTYGMWINDKPSLNRIQFLRENYLDSSDTEGRLWRFSNLSTSRTIPFPDKEYTVNYYKYNGFHGLYNYRGEVGKVTGNVDLFATFNGSNGAIKVNGVLEDGLTIGGDYYAGLYLSDVELTNRGISREEKAKTIYFGTWNNRDEKTFDTFPLAGTKIAGKGTVVLSEDGSDTEHPSSIAGEVKIRAFKNLSSDDASTHSLIGAFHGHKVLPVGRDRRGEIDGFPYGIWASEIILKNQIGFLEWSGKQFNPGRAASDYTAHTYHSTASGDVVIRYKKEDGFKGVYIYEGETGTLTGDVDLGVGFNGFGAIIANGNILTDLEIGGYDLKGIAIGNAKIAGRGTDNTHNNGVGYTDMNADGIDINNLSVKFSFGDFLADLNAIDRPTVNNYGLARKLRLVLSPDGIQAQGSTPETYPSQIAGELEINGFKIKDSDVGNNTVVGVFVADKQEQ